MEVILSKFIRVLEICTFNSAFGIFKMNFKDSFCFFFSGFLPESVFWSNETNFTYLIQPSVWRRSQRWVWKQHNHSHILQLSYINWELKTNPFPSGEGRSKWPLELFGHFSFTSHSSAFWRQNEGKSQSLDLKLNFHHISIKVCIKLTHLIE